MERCKYCNRDICECYRKLILLSDTPKDITCRECGLVEADEWYVKDGVDTNRAGGYWTPWCLLCIAAYRIEQFHKSLKAVDSILAQVKEKYGYETYAGLEEVMRGDYEW